MSKLVREDVNCLVCNDLHIVLSDPEKDQSVDYCSFCGSIVSEQLDEIEDLEE